MNPDPALPVFVTVDVGPALATLPPRLGAAPDWEPTFAGIAPLRDLFRRFAQELGSPVPVTWFVRADDVVARDLGDALAVRRRFDEAILADGGAAADEIGWMPLLPARADGYRAVEGLAAIHAALVDACGPVASLRLGNLSHDDATMAAADALGLAVDSSAVPGRRKDDPGWAVDWMPTPTRPYHPAVADFRQPGEPARGVLELPINALPIRTSYDAAPRLRYVNPCFHPSLLWQNLSPLLLEADHLVLLLHPDEVVPELAPAGHPMVAYSTGVCAANFARLVDELKQAGRRPTFHRVADATALVATGRLPLAQDAGAGASRCA